MGVEAPLRVLIVDDEPLAVTRLATLCATICGIEVVGTTADGAGALCMVAALEPDLVLLDIAMPGLSGLEAARALGRLPRRPAVVFCTAYDDHAIEAFEVAAVDYLLKPVTAERLNRAVGRVRDGRLAAGNASSPPSWLTELWVPHRSEMMRLPVAIIDRIEAERDYVRLHVGERSHLLHSTMSALEQRLDPAMFLRLHRSTIVRRGVIERLRHDGLGVWTAVLSGGIEQRLSRSYASDIRRTLGTQ